MACSWPTRKEAEINRRKCWTVRIREIFVAWIFLEATYKPSLGIILTNMSEWHLVGGLLFTAQGGKRECHLLRHKTWLYAVAPVYTSTINMRYGSVKKKTKNKKKKTKKQLHWSITTFSAPELLKLECALKRTGDPMRHRLDFSSSGMRPRVCIFNKVLSEAADAAGPGSEQNRGEYLEQHLSKANWPPESRQGTFPPGLIRLLL